MAAVTLKMRSRSCGQYIANGVVQVIIYQSRIYPIFYKISAILPILFPIGLHVKLNFGLKTSLENDIWKMPKIVSGYSPQGSTGII